MGFSMKLDSMNLNEQAIAIYVSQNKIGSYFY